MFSASTRRGGGRYYKIAREKKDSKSRVAIEMKGFS